MINRPDKLPEIEGTPQTDEPEAVRADRRSVVLAAIIAGALLASRAVGAGNDPRRGAASVVVEQEITPMERSFRLLPERPGLVPWLKEQAQGRAAILPGHEDRRQYADVLPEPEEIRRQPCRGPGGRRRAHVPLRLAARSAIHRRHPLRLGAALCPRRSRRHVAACCSRRSTRTSAAWAATLLKGYGFRTDQLGVKTEASYAGAVLTLAYTRVGGGTDIQKPWSGTPRLYQRHGAELQSRG